jgi:hypothetical protein
MPFPTNTEVNNTINSTYNSGLNTAQFYNVANNESPIQSAKWRGLFSAIRPIFSWLRDVVAPIIDGRNEGKFNVSVGNFAITPSGVFENMFDRSNPNTAIVLNYQRTNLKGIFIVETGAVWVRSGGPYVLKFKLERSTSSTFASGITEINNSGNPVEHIQRGASVNPSSHQLYFEDDTAKVAGINYYYRVMIQYPNTLLDHWNWQGYTFWKIR